MKMRAQGGPRILFYLTLFTAGPLGLLAGGDLPMPSCGWKAGDSWNLVVDAYSTTWAAAYSDPRRQAEMQKEQIAARYSVRVRVSGSTVVSNATVWQVEFRPGKDAPKMLQRDHCVLWIRDHDRRLLKGRHIYVNNVSTNVLELDLEEKDGIQLIREPPAEFPLQLWPLSVPPQTTLQEDVPRQVLRVQRQREGTDEVLEARVQIVGADGIPATQMRVTQKWTPGRHWWTSYECVKDGHWRTRAWLDSAVPKEPPVTTLPPR